MKLGGMINSSAEIQLHCLSAEFCTYEYKTSHYYMCVLFGTHLKKLFSQIDSLSALADTMKNFLTEQSRKALIFAAKSFYRSNLWEQILLGVFLP